MVMEIITSVFLLFVGIAILVLIHICIVRRDFRREFGIDGIPIIEGAGMTLQDLEKLPCFEYNQGDEEVTSATSPTILDCAVCLDNFKVGDSCRMLPNCHHYFHVHCVDAWLIKTPFCPICRAYTKMLSKVISPRIGRAENNPAPIVLDEFV